MFPKRMLFERCRITFTRLPPPAPIGAGPTLSCFNLRYQNLGEDKARKLRAFTHLCPELILTFVTEARGFSGTSSRH